MATFALKLTLNRLQKTKPIIDHYALNNKPFPAYYFSINYANWHIKHNTKTLINMADDLNKNIIINITAETGKLEENITGISKSIDGLLDQQKKLVDSGKQTSDTYKSNSEKLDDYQKSLQSAITQLNNYITAVNSAIGTLQKDQALINTLTATRDKYAKTLGDNSKKVKDLNDAIKTLTTTSQQQNSQAAQSQSALDKHGKSMESSTRQAADLKGNLNDVTDALGQQKKDVDENAKSFDAHKAVMDHLKTSFDEIKGVSGEFGPSLQEASKGFDMMKSGLSVVKDGIMGMGDALKADGLEFLLTILQKIFDAFINSSTGTKVLHGAISAIGVIVNKVKGFFGDFMNGLINAVKHPIDSLKNLGTAIEQNIINRFTAFSTILDGLLHLDFKKVGEGVLQAATGITDVAGKITKFVKGATDEIIQTGKEIGEAYTNGYNEAGKAQAKYHKQRTGNGRTKPATPQRDTTPLGPASSVGISGTDNQPADTISTYNLAATQSDAIKVVDIHKTALQQIADYAKKNEQKIAIDALNTLSNSIKQQAAAKVAALEAQKNAELSNTTLTGSQRAIIEAKYKKQEDKVKAKAFKEEQEISIAQALINGAVAVTKVSSQEGAIAPFHIGLIIAETAAQVAKIASQKPPAYATGGLHYTSDGKGGMLPGYSRTDNTNAYLRSGEGIVVSEAMRDPWARNLVSAINVGFGGRDFSTTATGRGFAVGGIFTDGGDANRYYNAPVNDQKNLANSIAYQMVNNFPPVYVDVKDINNQQNILAQTINRVNL
jgi:hypothetical protein